MAVSICDIDYRSKRSKKVFAAYFAIKITIFMVQETRKIVLYYRRVIETKKVDFVFWEGVLCLFGTFWDQNHTCVSDKKSG